jgi:dUTP pyrophosphatase
MECQARWIGKDLGPWVLLAVSLAKISPPERPERVRRDSTKVRRYFQMLAALMLRSACAATIGDMLRVKRLAPAARLPIVAHPGEDLGYDVFALEGAVLAPRATVKLRTGIAVEARHPETGAPLGLLVRDRSSMAARGMATTGGVIDAGYRGEILIVMINLGDVAVELQPGEKIAQMVPVPVLTGSVQEVEALEDSVRAAKGFGSTGT